MLVNASPKAHSCCRIPVPLPVRVRQWDLCQFDPRIAEAEGYEFGKEWGTAMVHYNYTLYTFDKPIDTYTDELAVGFMTWMPNGTIIRVDSKDTNDFIEIKMVCAT